MYTDYGNIQRKKYNKCGHIHSSAKCCKTKFTQIGTRYGQTYLIPNIQAYMQVAHKDTFFKTPVHFGGGQEIGMSLLEHNSVNV